MADYITAAEAERILRRSRRTVSRWADAGTLEVAHKLPGPTGARLFRRSDVEALRAELDRRYEPDEVAS